MSNSEDKAVAPAPQTVEHKIDFKLLEELHNTWTEAKRVWEDATKTRGIAESAREIVTSQLRDLFKDIPGLQQADLHEWSSDCKVDGVPKFHWWYNYKRKTVDSVNSVPADIARQLVARADRVWELARFAIVTDAYRTRQFGSTSCSSIVVDLTEPDEEQTTKKTKVAVDVEISSDSE